MVYNAILYYNVQGNDCMANVKNKENSYRILLALAEGEKRFSELTNEIKKASVAKELSYLLELRYITRRVVEDTKPPRTFYKITKMGLDFLQNEVDEHVSKLDVELQRLKTFAPDKFKKLKKNF